ncbi:RloB domain-containing protein [Paenibacillus sp. NRS-1782]|uniref:RloB domain-containing protein n=1 Tax=unclassified Paenibacillus TaxID=185978 RepID=UPI003D2D548A
MSKMKNTRKYYFSVEGETEDWYLEWLQKIINSEPSARFKVSLDSKIEKNPLKRAKSIPITQKTEITHFFDCESNDAVHTKQFIATLNLLKDTSKLGKQIKYNLGYSNFTFELWMVLHKIDFNTILTHRRQYLKPINKAFGENSSELDQYKQKVNFRRVLSKISLVEVRAAIARSKGIMQRNKENGFTMNEYKGYQYYMSNPCLSVWESIEKILKDCDLL